MALVFVTGASGFIGRALSRELLKRGHRVRGLVRKGSEGRTALGCEMVVGDPLNRRSYEERVAGADTFVHLTGVSHPNPKKAEQFRSIDLASAKIAVAAAGAAGIRHFVYVSVAHPAPIMKEYIAARSDAEACLRGSGLNATILRPWYVLGPGRWWPLFLLPVYAVLGVFPSTRESARRLGLVTQSQMVRTMVEAIEHPANGVRVLEVPQIRAGSL
jgi:uncharacterized protein YbjT (DUF2867 family)